MENKKLLFLCGFMGCGKTTQGKKLAKALWYHFIDLDEYTANKYDKDITDIFQEFGEDEFRKIETVSLTECISDNIKTVIALGGGTPCFNNNIELLQANGILIYLKMSADDLYKRLFKETAKRPLVANKETDELYIYIKELLVKREVFYNQANISVDGNLYEVDEMKQLVVEAVTPKA